MQSPKGLPKLANVILDMYFLGGHRSWTLGLLPWWFLYLFCLRISVFHEITGGGLESETCPHTFVTETMSTDMLRGLPPSSSNNTNRLSVGLRKDLGMWYLILWVSEIRKKTKILKSKVWVYVMIDEQVLEIW